jgi:hypothetical protein
MGTPRFDDVSFLGSLVGHLHTWLSNLILEASIKTVKVVTFGQRATRTDFGCDSIGNWAKPGTEGATYIAAAAKMALEDVIASFPDDGNALCQVVVISDGEVHDMAQLLAYISSKPAEAFGTRTLQVTGLRVGTGGDTQALTCFFKFHNHPTVAQRLIDVSRDNDEVQMALLDIFDSLKKGMHVYSSTLEAPDEILKRHSFNSSPTRCLGVADGDYFLVHGAPEALDALLLDGQKPVLVERPVLDEEEVLHYLVSLEIGVRNFKVLGEQAPLEGVKVFLEDLKSVLKSQVFFRRNFFHEVLPVEPFLPSSYPSLFHSLFPFP